MGACTARCTLHSAFGRAAAPLATGNGAWAPGKKKSEMWGKPAWLVNGSGFRHGFLSVKLGRSAIRRAVNTANLATGQRFYDILGAPKFSLDGKVGVMKKTAVDDKWVLARGHARALRRIFNVFCWRSTPSGRPSALRDRDER